jgi:hypothetical protein
VAEVQLQQEPQERPIDPLPVQQRQEVLAGQQVEQQEPLSLLILVLNRLCCRLRSRRKQYRYTL